MGAIAGEVLAERDLEHLVGVELAHDPGELGVGETLDDAGELVGLIVTHDLVAMLGSQDDVAGLVRYAQEHGITVPPEGLFIPTGVAFPVVIMLIVTLVVTFLATRRRFGRYVYAIGGNPDAAALAGINVRRTIIKGILRG